MKEDKTYNGWTNYATWRVNIEIFDGNLFEGEEVSAEILQDYVDEILFFNDESSNLREGYARAFLAYVNWHEIAQHINEYNEVEDE